MFGSLLKLAADVVALPVDAVRDVAERIVDPDDDRELRTVRRFDLIADDLDLED